MFPASAGFKIKSKIPDFEQGRMSPFSGTNYPSQIGFTFHGAGRNILNILRINPPQAGYNSNARSRRGIGWRRKGAFFKGLVAQAWIALRKLAKSGFIVLYRICYYYQVRNMIILDIC